MRVYILIPSFLQKEAEAYQAKVCNSLAHYAIACYLRGRAWNIHLPYIKSICVVLIVLTNPIDRSLDTVTPTWSSFYFHRKIRQTEQRRRRTWTPSSSQFRRRRSQLEQIPSRFSVSSSSRASAQRETSVSSPMTWVWRERQRREACMLMLENRKKI